MINQLTKKGILLPFFLKFIAARDIASFILSFYFTVVSRRQIEGTIYF